MMLDPEPAGPLRRAVRASGLVPTPLIPDTERQRVPIVTPQRKSPRERLALRLRLLRWGANFWWSSLRGREPGADLARELSALLQQAGGAAVKIGQLLSLRPDVFSPEFCNVLSGLQFQAVGFPPAVARAIVEREIGRPIDEVFDVFEDAPIAAASIAQVHRARLRRENVWVAVKVQRPHVAEDFAEDLVVARRWIARIKRLRRLEHFSWDEMIWELEEVVREEIDYRYEAANMRRMRKNLKRHGVQIPRVYEYSTAHVLVMEYVAGVLMSDILEMGRRDPERLQAWYRENNIDPERVARRLFFSFQRQVHEDNCFHGDLHPGNIIVLRDSCIALIDLGSVGTLDPETVEKLRHYYHAVAERDLAAAADYTLLFVGRLPRMDPEAFKPEIARVFRSWLGRSEVRELSYKEKAFSEAGIEVSRLIAKHRVLISWQFMRVNRAGMTLEASLRFLQPKADQARLIRRYVQKLDRRLERALLPTLSRQLGQMQHELSFAADLQERILRERGRTLEATASKLSRVFALLFGVMGWASLAAVGALVVSRSSLLLAAATLAAFFTLRRLRDFFLLPEVRP
jgi:ubiquinone biosynthesis protein